MKRNFTFLLILSLFIIQTIKAQESGKLEKMDVNPSRDNAWGIGIMGGLPMVWGDVNAQFGLGYGIDVQKSFSENFLLRVEVLTGNAYGMNKKFSTLEQEMNNPALNGKYDPRTDYFDAGKQVIDNYKMNYYELNLFAHWNIISNNFLGADISRFNVYLLFGPGMMLFSTYSNLLDANGKMYDYTTVLNNYTSGKIKQSDIPKNVRQLLDDTYETPADGNDIKQSKNNDAYHNTLLNYNTIFTLSGGLGIRYRISDRLDISLSERASLTFNNTLDGERYNSQGNITGQDVFLFTALGVNMRLGKKSNVYWFDNTSAMLYKVTLRSKNKVDSLSNKVNSLSHKVDVLSQKFDLISLNKGNGVLPDSISDKINNMSHKLDLLSQKVNHLPPDNNNSGGNNLDNAKIDSLMSKINDAYHNINDAYHNIDLLSQKVNHLSSGNNINNSRVNNNNVENTKNVDNTKIDSLIIKINNAYHIIDLLSQKVNLLSPTNTGEGRTIPQSNMSGIQTGTSMGFLPVIFFESEMYTLTSEAMTTLNTVAQGLKANPNIKIKVIGYTDEKGPDAYNQQLAYKRAQSVVDYLLLEGISSDRLLVVGKGKMKPLTNIVSKDNYRISRRAQIEILNLGETINKEKQDSKNVKKPNKPDFEQFKKENTDKH